MKKTLRFIVMLIAVLIAIGLILAIVEPTDIKVTRTALIRAPKEAVFEQVVKFRNWPNWSAWHSRDTAMKIVYTGTDGNAGSAYSWESANKDLGAGSMTDKAVSGTRMDYHIDIIRPFKGTAEGWFNVSDSARSSRITWVLMTHCPFPLNAMQAFVDMDKKIGGDFELGLNKLKSYVEGHTLMIDVKETEYPERIIAGMRKTISMAEITRFCGEAFGAVARAAGDKINGPATGIYYTWDTTSKTTDMVAGFPVSDTSVELTEGAYIHTGPAHAFMAVLKGGYGGEMPVHAALQNKVSASHRKELYVIEEYPVGPKNEPDTTRWITNIYYIVQ